MGSWGWRGHWGVVTEISADEMVGTAAGAKGAADHVFGLGNLGGGDVADGLRVAVVEVAVSR